MERIEYHTPEEKKVCDWIHRQRLKNRKHLLHKSITLPVLFVEGKTLSVKLDATFTKKTSNIAYTHCIRYNRHDFHPTTNQKRRCTNNHAKNQYYKSLETTREYLDRIKHIHLYVAIEPYIQHFERIDYRPSGNIGIVCGFISASGKLKYINEK